MRLNVETTKVVAFFWTLYRRFSATWSSLFTFSRLNTGIFGQRFEFSWELGPPTESNSTYPLTKGISEYLYTYTYMLNKKSHKYRNIKFSESNLLYINYIDLYNLEQTLQTKMGTYNSSWLLSIVLNVKIITATLTP